MSATDAAAWSHAARGARARVWRRRAAQAAFAVLMIPGLMQLTAILVWAVRLRYLGALVPGAVHILAVALALGWPARDARPDEATGRFLARLLANYRDRAGRLHALRFAVLVETGLLAAYPPIVMLATGASPRWGVPFVIALCALTVLWPLERIARAQRLESERLARLS